MRVLYANQNIAKYRVEGKNYFMALIGATFFLLITGFLLLMMLFSIFPKMFQSFVAISLNINSIFFALILVAGVFLLLRAFVREEDIKYSNFSKEYINKMINYFIAYTIVTVIVIGVIGMKLLPSN